MQRDRFVAYASRLQALVGIACFLPIVAAAIMNLVLLPDAPWLLRAFGVLVALPFLIWFGIAARLIFMGSPVLEVDETGLLWKRWSDTRIPWSAFERWEVRQTAGISVATLWLHEPERYRAATVNRLLGFGNRWLGYGDLTLNAAGTDRTFEELTSALRDHGPALKSAARNRT